MLALTKAQSAMRDVHNMKFAVKITALHRHSQARMKSSDLWAAGVGQGGTV